MRLPSPGIALLVAVAACNGAAVEPDAGGGPDAGPLPTFCHPVFGPGCPDDYKCAFILDDPGTGLGHTGCAPQGRAAIGEVCMEPQLPGETDDCRSGGHCYTGRCKAMCAVGFDTCASDEACFDVDPLDFDVCLQLCDALAQDCPDTESGKPQGCYLTQNGTVCAAPVGGGQGAPPGEPCIYQNECSVGSGCFDDGMGAGVCLHYCDFATHGLEPDPDNCQPAEICARITGEDIVGVCVEP